MILVLLEGLEGFETRIRIIQADHEPDVHTIVVEVVEKTAAIGVGVERPAQGVLNQAGLHAAWRQLPQFFESQAIGLRRLAGVELEALDQLLGDTAAAAFAEQGELGVNLGAQGEVRPGPAVLFNAHISDAHTFHAAGVIEQGLGRRKPGEHVDSELFRLRAQNRHQLSERNDEVAMVGHLRRGGQAEPFAAGHEQEFVPRGGYTDPRRLLAPIGKQFIERPGFEHGARQGMGAQAGGLFQHADAQVRFELFQPDGGREARRSGAHNGDLVFHDIARAFVHQLSPKIQIGAQIRPEQVPK